MKGSSVRKIITALAALALAVMAAVAPVSPANAITCTATGQNPYELASSNAVVGRGTINCSGGSGNLSVRAYLTMNGVQKDVADHYCSAATSCTVFATFAPDPSSNQTWCTWALAYVQGSFVDQSPTYCESASNP